MYQVALLTLLLYGLLASGFHLFQGPDYLFLYESCGFHFEILLDGMLLENL